MQEEGRRTSFREEADEAQKVLTSLEEEESTGAASKRVQLGRLARN